jgi:RNA polymerase sigma-70 factor, ECF subfamily
VPMRKEELERYARVRLGGSRVLTRIKIMLEFTQAYDADRGDQHLVRMALERNRAALERLFGQYRPHLHHAALRLCGCPEEAEDALQDGLFSAFQHLHHFQARSQFSTWLTRIVINATLMRLRKRRNRMMTSIDQEDQNGRTFAGTLRDDAFDPEAAYAEREAFEILQRRLYALPQSYRDIFWLRDVEGLSTEEAANALGVSEGTVKSALHRARVKLAKVAGEPTVQKSRPVRVADSTICEK